MKKLLLILSIAIVATTVIKDVTLKFPKKIPKNNTQTDTTKGSLQDYLDNLPYPLDEVYKEIQHKWDEIRKNIKNHEKEVAKNICKGILVKRDQGCIDLIDGAATYFENED